MTFAQYLFLASLQRRCRAVLSSVAGIEPLSYTLLLKFFGAPHIFRIQKYAKRNLSPITGLPHTATRRILDR